MKPMNFSVVEVLPSLLNKTKKQTIRPAWKDDRDKFSTGSGKDGVGMERERLKPNNPVCIRRTATSKGGSNPPPSIKPPKYKVGEKVRLYWKQRSKYQWFCSGCGLAWNLKELGMFEGLNCEKGYKFNKILGKVEITEIWKINMGKDFIEKTYWNLDIKGEWIELRMGKDFYETWLRNLAFRDGFKGETRVTKMFKVIDKFYDLDKAKPFYPYIWRWL